MEAKKEEGNDNDEKGKIKEPHGDGPLTGFWGFSPVNISERRCRARNLERVRVKPPSRGRSDVWR